MWLAVVGEWVDKQSSKVEGSAADGAQAQGPVFESATITPINVDIPPFIFSWVGSFRGGRL